MIMPIVGARNMSVAVPCHYIVDAMIRIVRNIREHGATRTWNRNLRPTTEPDRRREKTRST